MTVFNWIAAASWLAFLGYWTASAFNVKKDTMSQKWRNGASLHLVIVLVLLAFGFVHPAAIRGIFSSLIRGSSGMALQAAGAALSALGIALAIWARFHLGRNWSSYPSLKENHELVTSGPYRLLRHPIYTGILTAILGTVFVSGQAVWLLVLILVGILFVRRVYVEEGIMTQTFPDVYPTYKKRTKALIPFVW